MAGSYPPVQGGQWPGYRPPYPPPYPPPPYPRPPGGPWTGPGGYWPPPPPPQRSNPARWAIVGLVLVMFVAFAVTTLAYAVSRSSAGSRWNAGTGVAAAPVPSGTPAGSPGDLSSVAAAV